MSAAVAPAVAFRHDDAGTPEPDWLLDPRWSGVAAVDVDALPALFDDVVVASAHPDDETLAVGGLVALAHRAGLTVRVLVVTDGSASHPDASTWTPAALAAVRRSEVEAAVEMLAPGIPVDHLDVPDGGVAEAEGAVVDALVARCGPRTLLIAPSDGDGHPDHDALGRAALEAGRRTGATVAHYPLWLWHWGGPDDLGWSDVHAVELDRAALDAKAAAVTAHASQHGPLGPGPGDGPVVTGPVLRRAARLVEVLLAPPGALPVRPPRTTGLVGAPFEAMYDTGDDPWAFEGSFYESRKRDLALAALLRPRYRRVLEVGCAGGRLTERLVERADTVVAVDVSARALDVARGRDLAGVDWRPGRAPDAVGGGPFDLVVLSEVGYFLTPLELLATVRRCLAALADDGEVLLVHWRHPTSGVPLDGPAVHAQAAPILARLPHRVRHEEADLLLDLWGGGALSPAQREDRA